MCLKKHFWHLSAILFVIIFAISTGAKAQSVAPVVFNAGVGGNNTVDLLRRIDKDCLGKNPDLTVLMIVLTSIQSLPEGTGTTTESTPLFQETVQLVILGLESSFHDSLMRLWPGNT